MKKQKIIQLNAPAELNYSPLIRQIAEDIFSMWHFNNMWCHRLKLVVDELFMNAVKYGSPAEEGIIYIQFIDEENRTTFVIEDQGNGRNKSSVKEVRKRLSKNENCNPARTSGRGLSVIAKLWTDTMNIAESEQGGIKVSFTKKKIDDREAARDQSIKISTLPIDVKKKSTHTIELKGDVDQYNLKEKSKWLGEYIKKIENHAELVLDFHDVEYVNSVFIGHLAAWYNELKKRDIVLKIRGASEAIKDTLDVVGLNKIVIIS